MRPLQMSRMAPGGRAKEIMDKVDAEAQRLLGLDKYDAPLYVRWVDRESMPPNVDGLSQGRSIMLLANGHLVRLIRAYVHELVHVKQHMEHRLIDMPDGSIEWEGQRISAAMAVHGSNLARLGLVDPARWLPWETEAYGTAEPMKWRVMWSALSWSDLLLVFMTSVPLVWRLMKRPPFRWLAL